MEKQKTVLIVVGVVLALVVVVIYLYKRRWEIVTTPPEAVVCGLCGESFATMEELETHARQVHPQEYIPIAPPPLPEPPAPELAYFYASILWQRYGKTEWNNHWLNLSETELNVIPAGEPTHPHRVEYIAIFVGATAHVGSVPFTIEVYRDGAKIASKVGTMGLQYYEGPQQWRSFYDWTDCPKDPGLYRIVTTITFQNVAVTRTYNYLFES